MKYRLLTILSLGLLLPSFTSATIVPAGEDTFKTQDGGASIDFSSLGMPGTVNPGRVDLMGNPSALGFNNVDTIVKRKQALDLDVGEEGVVEIELIALSLKCVEPIDLEFMGAPPGTLADCYVTVNTNPSRFPKLLQPDTLEPSTGQTTIRRDSLDGGTFLSILDVYTDVIFIKAGGKFLDPNDFITSVPDPNAPIMLEGVGNWAFPFIIKSIDHKNRSGPNHPHDVEPNFVALNSFTARIKPNGQVAIKWTTGIERNNAGFRVLRANPLNGECSTDPSNYINVKAVTPLVNSRGNSIKGATYNYTDNSSLIAGETYCYALADIEFDSEEPTFHLDQTARIIAR